MSKRVASKKLAKRTEQPAIDCEGNFEKYKEVELAIVNQQILIANRIDTYMHIHATAKEFYGDAPSFDRTRQLQAMGLEVFEEIKRRIEAMSYEDLCIPEEDFQDPFRDMMAADATCVSSMDEALEEFLKYQFIKPIAENMLMMNRQVMADKAGADAAAAVSAD